MTPILFRALAPLMVACLPVVALAEETPLSIKIDGAVALEASVLAEGTLNEAQVQVLKDVAHQKAVVLTCEGYAIDDTRFGGVLAAAYPDDAAFNAMDEDAQLHMRSVIMLVLGTFLGGNLAIAATDAAAWCTSAAEEKGQTDAPNRIWAD
ncbi:MAG: hypothetical protein O9328_17320 [Rhodobacteraceae bacterium]|nr:hypothetical protein [Paracoccaceae bacterium]